MLSFKPFLKIGVILAILSFSGCIPVKRLIFFFKTDKKDRQNKSHYRPISVIGVFSKIIERFIETKLNNYIEDLLSIFIAAYRKKYSTNHVLIRLLEDRKKNLDNKKFVGAGFDGPLKGF